MSGTFSRATCPGAGFRDLIRTELFSRKARKNRKFRRIRQQPQRHARASENSPQKIAAKNGAKLNFRVGFAFRPHPPPMGVYLWPMVLPIAYQVDLGVRV